MNAATGLRKLSIIGVLALMLHIAPGGIALAGITHGIITYDGAKMGRRDGAPGKNVPFVQILDEWPTYRADVTADFEDIRERFGAKSVRLLLYPMYPEWDNLGLNFPTPRSRELKNLGRIIDAAHSKGLQTYIVLILPKEYRLAHPDTIDTFYAKNGVPLVRNLFVFWENVFNLVLVSRMDKVSYIDILGDFDPLNVYGAMTGGQLANHQEWWRRIWPNFHSWFTYIPNAKKTFELIGGARNPPEFIAQEITWVKNELRRRGWPSPGRFAFQAFACASWANGYTDWYTAYFRLFESAATAAGGWDKILVEEIGVNHNGRDCTDDQAGGGKTFLASFSVLADFAPDVPVGTWVYYDAPSPPNSDRWGLYGPRRTLRQGWWVLPYFFCGPKLCR